jgi:hypothetical protein
MTMALLTESSWRKWARCPVSAQTLEVLQKALAAVAQKAALAAQLAKRQCPLPANRHGGKSTR